jgi:carboxypeptidase Q
MRKIFISLAALFFLFPIIHAQTCQSPNLSYKVKDEAFNHSHVDRLAEFMTDFLGPRLAASQQKLRAEQMVMDTLRAWNLENVRSEAAADFQKGGWDNERTYVAMTKPYYCSFHANPKAWSGSTDGLVNGSCVLLDIKDISDLDKYKGKIEGKIVLMPVRQTYEMSFEPLAERISDEDLQAMEKDRRPYSRRWIRPDRRAQDSLAKAVMNMLKEEKALAIIDGSGEFNVADSRGVAYKVGEPEPLPEIILPIEDHGRMARLLSSGVEVEMEIDVHNKFTDNQKINNIFAEIPGTDKKLKDEVVMIGAHLDSWHGGTGASDNAVGCIVMMEAIRILRTIGIQPRRTIRLALWGGEEQGMYGSKGYASKYLYDEEKKEVLPGFDDFALYLNMDYGAGRFRGIYLEENDEAFPFLEAWMKPLESLGFTTLTPRRAMGTDCVTFSQLGLPSYQFIQDPLEYDRSYHTTMDTYERLILSDLKVNACITAWLALNAAMDDARIPAKAGYPEAIR